MNMAETVTTSNSWDDLRPPGRLVLLSESDGLSPCCGTRSGGADS